jgi:hypothetical protein
LGEETFAGMRRNGRDAPKAVTYDPPTLVLMRSSAIFYCKAADRNAAERYFLL